MRDDHNLSISLSIYYYYPSISTIHLSTCYYPPTYPLAQINPRSTLHLEKVEIFSFMKGVFIVGIGLIGCVFGFIEQYQPQAPIVIVKELKKSTVTLSVAKVYVRHNSGEEWEELKGNENFGEESSSMRFSDENGDVAVEMAVYEAPTKEWVSLTKVGVDSHISKIVQHGSKVNFLWTSSSTGYYMFLFRVLSDYPKKGMEVGLDVVTYEGRPEDPSIYSHTDSQMRNKEKRLAECINVSREIIELQELDRMDEEVYRKEVDKILQVIILAVVLKITVFIGSFSIINRKIQDFYVAKRIVS